MTKRGLPKYVYEDRGYLRFIRRARGQSVMMPEEFGTEEFWDHYNRLLKGQVKIPSKRTFEGLALSYFESDAWTKLKPRTKSDYRKYIEHIRQIWGDKDPQKIETHHIYALHQANRDRWRQANYLVQVLVVLLNHAKLIGFIKKEHGNPAHGIPLFKQPGDGWEPWPDDMRAEFEAVAPPRARLVYELCVGTGQRIGDVLKFRWNHFTEDAFDFTQGKTDKPMWIPMTDRLRHHLETVPKEGLTVVCGAKGRPANYRVITDEMLAVRQSMQHPDAKSYVTHGLRKNATIELYLAGCDDEMVKAVTGHSGVEMLKKYGGMVRQRELATRAQEARNRAERNKSGT
ncbi:tyrosine recombinase XerC [Paracoccus sp. IB05]|uniref:site-specific integrase n=1 Tax=Paracoccus sp. IB05 TaxID=2779367 RepID=UPI0018E88CE0|nr:tyrosine-type recombinase/integrase [Paracoccus sp. IB05]MBJ2152687.1 tyrosine-type recombinase/integrase [Paracoccus sp. IB05]